MDVRKVLVGAVIVFGLAACGGGGGEKNGGVASAGGGKGSGASAAPTKSMSPQEARVKFAECMRKNGVDMPDPTEEKGVMIKNKKGDQATTEAAMKKCQPILKAGGDMPDANDPKVRDAMVKFAECMRKQGIDMPDPEPGGGIRMRVKEGTNPEAVEKAQKACEHLQPGRKR